MKFLPSLLVPLTFLFSGNLVAQIGFTKHTELLTPSEHYSGIAIGVTDVNGDGLDDIIRLDQGQILSVSYQAAPNQPFTLLQLSSVSNESQWGMCAADVDNNGYSDFMSGGSYDGIKFITANEDGTDYNTVVMSAPQTFVQNVNFADVNNDGWLDAFVCHDDGVARIFGNNGDGTFTYQQNWIDLTTVPVSDNSGNYGSIFSDVNNDGLMDLYIAKCRQGVNNPADARRINQLFLNNGDGTFGLRQRIGHELSGGTGISVTDLDGDGDNDIAAMAEGKDRGLDTEHPGGLCLHCSPPAIETDLVGVFYTGKYVYLSRVTEVKRSWRCRQRKQ
mgnify:CR=1 FL=1